MLISVCLLTDDVGESTYDLASREVPDRLLISNNRKSPAPELCGFDHSVADRQRPSHLYVGCIHELFGYVEVVAESEDAAVVPRLPAARPFCNALFEPSEQVITASDRLLTIAREVEQALLGSGDTGAKSPGLYG